MTNKNDSSDKSESIRNIFSSESHIYMWWKWWDIYDEINRKINREDYGKSVWDVAIIEEKKEIQWIHLLDDIIYKPTWNYFIVCETSRGTYLHKKYIPKKILPLFSDILEKANAKWKYMKYEIITR